MISKLLTLCLYIVGLILCSFGGWKTSLGIFIMLTGYSIEGKQENKK